MVHYYTTVTKASNVRVGDFLITGRHSGATVIEIETITNDDGRPVGLVRITGTSRDGLIANTYKVDEKLEVERVRKA